MKFHVLVLAALTLGLLGVTTLTAAPENVQVGDVRAVLAKDGTTLRERPSSLAKASATFPYASTVSVEEVKGSWIRVTAAPGQEATGGGWLRASQTVEPFALTQRVTGSDGGAAANVSERDISAAGRQFDPATEESYRGEHPDLDAMYPLVDAIEKATPSDEALRRFVLEGRLGRPAEGE